MRKEEGEERLKGHVRRQSCEPGPIQSGPKNSAREETLVPRAPPRPANGAPISSDAAAIPPVPPQRRPDPLPPPDRAAPPTPPLPGLLLSSPFLLTKLLTVYASLGDLPCTLRLFSLLPHPRSLFAWTPSPLPPLPLLPPPALPLLLLPPPLLPTLPAPDPFLFPPVLRSAAAAPAPAAPRLAVPALHADALKFASDGPLPVANALVSAYARRGDLAAARRAFDLIPARRRDLLSWNSVLAAYAAAAASGGLPELELLLRSMRSQGLEPDLVTWNTLMDGYCRAGRCDEARDILLRGAPDPNAVSWTTVISGYARAANHEASLRLFQRMTTTTTTSRGGVSPDADALACVVSSCRHVSAFLHGREVHAYGLKTMDRESFYGSAGAALVALYASCSKISAVRSVFRAMDPTDVVTWNSVIHALVHAGLPARRWATSNKCTRGAFRVTRPRSPRLFRRAI
uniref:Pentatricopeptide repeat-containing protein n=1 Tax=Ananas comosus var. bracteatus TaxID=296719 RepID=A0A6V7Q5D9_ANACO|nr:unnamed protein product [Ananas comosus var. bracteatus]